MARCRSARRSGGPPDSTTPDLVTLHIDNQQLTRYGGNYSAFETLRAQQLALQQASFARQQEKIAHLQKFIDRFKAKASKAKQAQSRVKALARMEKLGPVLTSADFPEFGKGQGVAMGKGKTELKTKVDGAVDAMLKDGTVKTLSMKWFKVDISPKG